MDNIEDNNSTKPSYCPHCGKPKPLTERYCAMCGRDRSGGYAPYLAHALPQVTRKPQAFQDETYEERKKISGRAYAIAALTVSIFTFLSAGILTPVTLPIVIVCIAKSIKYKGNKPGFITASVIISLICTLMFAVMTYVIVKVFPDMRYMAEHGEEIVMNYDIDGTVPERFEKYRDKKYDKYWDIMGYDDFYDFFGSFVIENYRKSALKGKKYDAEDRRENPSEAAAEPDTSPSSEAVTSENDTVPAEIM